MKLNIIVLLNLILTNIYGQIVNFRLSLMQGIWENIMNSDTEKAYTIIKGMNSLNFVYNTSSSELNFPLVETLEGFQNFDSGDYDYLNIDSLREDGLYYTVVDKKYIDSAGWVKRPDYLTPSYFECDGTIMSINGGQLVEYVKISKLPYEALKRLYYRGKIDDRDYIKEYLDLNVTEIKGEKCFIYDENKNKTGLELKKGDIVVINEERGEWIKVEYGEGYKQGWIKKECIE